MAFICVKIVFTKGIEKPLEIRLYALKSKGFLCVGVTRLELVSYET